MLDCLGYMCNSHQRQQRAIQVLFYSERYHLLWARCAWADFLADIYLWDGPVLPSASETAKSKLSLNASWEGLRTNRIFLLFRSLWVNLWRTNAPGDRNRSLIVILFKPVISSVHHYTLHLWNCSTSSSYHLWHSPSIQSKELWVCGRWGSHLRHSYPEPLILWMRWRFHNVHLSEAQLSTESRAPSRLEETGLMFQSKYTHLYLYLFIHTYLWYLTFIYMVKFSAWRHLFYIYRSDMRYQHFIRITHTCIEKKTGSVCTFPPTRKPLAVLSAAVNVKLSIWEAPPECL